MKLFKASAGLLSFFEMKNEGQSPDQFGETVTPVIDIAEWYDPSIQTVLAKSGNVVGINDQIAQVIPAGQAWRVRGIGFTLNVPAVTTAVDGAGGWIGYNPGTTGFPIYELHAAPKVTPANNWNLSGGVVLPKPFLALPGTNLFFNNDRIYSTNCVLDLRIFYDPIIYP